MAAVDPRQYLKKFPEFLWWLWISQNYILNIFPWLFIFTVFLYIFTLIDSSSDSSDSKSLPIIFIKAKIIYLPSMIEVLPTLLSPKTDIFNLKW